MAAKKKKASKKAGKKKASKKKASKKSTTKASKKTKKRSKKRSKTAGCPPEVAEQVGRLAAANARLTKEVMFLKASKKATKKRKKSGASKKAITKRKTKESTVNVDALIKGASTKAKTEQALWLCAGPKRTGCGGGKKGGHVVGSLRLPSRR